jgi:hypothetical protein
MSGPAARPLYRQVTRKIRQGDISLAEFVQLRAPTDLKGPRDGLADQQLPAFGIQKPFDVSYTAADGELRKRVLYLWEGLVVVLHQNCEMEFASPDDSRLVVAPVVLEEHWPGGHWDDIRRGLLPGYFYLPPVSDEEATAMDVTPMPEGAAAIAGACVVGRDIVKPGRVASLTQTGVRELQDMISRFFAVRGYASTEDLPNIEGKRLAHLEDTGLTVDGPGRLIKMIFGEEASDEGDEEATVTYFGVRRSQAREAAVAASTAAAAADILAKATRKKASGGA